MKHKEKKIAVFIKTCHGRISLIWILYSVKFAFKNVDYRIYISDEKPLDEWKYKLYDKLTKEGHHIEIHKPGISCGVARNLLLDRLNDEELILRMDDDFELGGEFKIEALKTVLNVSDEIGFCSDIERQIGDNKGVKSGSIRPAGGEIIINPPKIIKIFHSPFKVLKRYNNIRYTTADHTRNLILIKRDVVEKVRWNEKIIFQGEHEDFMLSIKEAGFKGSYTPDSIHYHRDDLSFINNQYSNSAKYRYRPGEKEKAQELKNKWNCNIIVAKYPFSWYVIETVRRILNYLSV